MACCVKLHEHELIQMNVYSHQLSEIQTFKWSAHCEMKFIMSAYSRYHRAWGVMI